MDCTRSSVEPAGDMPTVRKLTSTGYRRCVLRRCGQAEQAGQAAEIGVARRLRGWFIASLLSRIHQSSGQPSLPRPSAQVVLEVRHHGILAAVLGCEVEPRRRKQVAAESPEPLDGAPIASTSPTGTVRPVTPSST
jgi:hypothetical protein